jgi:hypothetical protein
MRASVLGVARNCVATAHLYLRAQYKKKKSRDNNLGRPKKPRL